MNAMKLFADSRFNKVMANVITIRPQGVPEDVFAARVRKLVDECGEDPDMLNAIEYEARRFLVTGDAARNKELCVPGGGFATVRITLPKAWDKLMAERGYAPLDTFRIASNMKPDAPRKRVKPPTHNGARGDFDRPRNRQGFRRRREQP